MIITLLNVLLSIFLFIQQVIIFDGFVHIRSHFAHRILCSFFSVEHILYFCLYNRTCFREYAEKCACIFRCRIMKLIDCCLELWIFCDVIFEDLFVMCCCCYREVSCLCIPVCLRFRRYQIFYKFPCCCFFASSWLSSIQREAPPIDTPPLSSSVMDGKYAVPTSKEPFTS